MAYKLFVIATVIDAEALLIVIPTPAVNVAGAGVPPVVPTIICPSVNALDIEGIPVALDTKTALFAADIVPSTLALDAYIIVLIGLVVG